MNQLFLITWFSLHCVFVFHFPFLQSQKNLLSLGIKEVIWNFYESPVTGKAGASQPLFDALKEAGIKTQLIR